MCVCTLHVFMFYTVCTCMCLDAQCSIYIVCRYIPLHQYSMHICTHVCIYTPPCACSMQCVHMCTYMLNVCFMQYYTHLYFYTPCVFYAHVCMCTLQDTVCGEYISYSNTHCVWGDTHCVHGTMCAHMFMLHTHLFMSVSACVCVGRHPDHTGLSDRGSHIGQD